MSKTIMRVAKNKDNPYLMLNKTSIQDSKLSWKAKGLHAYLLSLPDDWKIYVEELTKHAKDGKDSTKATINELEKMGYISKNKLRDGSGRFKGYEYIIFEVSTEVIEPTSPKAEKPFTENPETDKPLTENPQLVINNNTNKLLKLNNNIIKESGKDINVSSKKTDDESNTFNALNNTNMLENNDSSYINNILVDRMTFMYNATLCANAEHTYIKFLISKYGEKKLIEALTAWKDRTKNCNILNVAGYFKTMLENGTVNHVEKVGASRVEQCNNFEQREYSEEELKQFYA